MLMLTNVVKKIKYAKKKNRVEKTNKQKKDRQIDIQIKHNRMKN